MEFVIRMVEETTNRELFVMKRKMSNLLFPAGLSAALLVSFVVASATFADPVVSDLVARQNWPWSRDVHIEYTLASETNCDVDVSLVLADDRRMALTAADTTGDLGVDVAPGRKRVVWDPTASGLTNSVLAGVRFSVDAANPEDRLYMVLDLVNGTVSYTNQVVSSAGNGQWDDVYKTDKLVLRRIEPGTLDICPSSGSVAYTLTKPFYIGVFEVTQAQYAYVRGFAPVGATGNAWPSYFTDADTRAMRPVENVSFADLYSPVATWPNSDCPSNDCFVGILRSKFNTGMFRLNLPTETQWAYAAQAGGLFGTAPVNPGNYGRGQENGGYIATVGESGTTYSAPTAAATPDEGGTAVVGSYAPSPCGLYDVMGNVSEFVMDVRAGWDNNRTFAEEYLNGATDPLGRTDFGWGGVNRREFRDLGWNSSTNQFDLIRRVSVDVTVKANSRGFRIVAQWPLEATVRDE